jgi:hypothetical protein
MTVIVASTQVNGSSTLKAELKFVEQVLGPHVQAGIL